MSTVNDIVTSSLRKIGMRDTTNTTLLANGLTALNNLLSSWEEILIPYTTVDSLTLIAGTNSYTIGVGGTINTTRPTSIVSAYIRNSDGYDFDVNVKLSRKDYDLVYDKDFAGRPTGLFYNPTNPLGTIYFDSSPSEVETFYMTSYKPISPYVALTDTILQPLEYEKAMIYNLAIDLAEENNIQAIQSVYQQAQILLNKITTRNSEPTSKAKLDLGLYRI
jgi:hypothetical protein